MFVSNAAIGVNRTMFPEKLKLTGTFTTPFFKVKVVEVKVEGSIVWLKVAVMTLFRGTLVAPLFGSVKITTGLIVLPVEKLQT